MDIYRKFVPLLRKLAFEEVHILLHDDISAKIKFYIKHVIALPFIDGKYHYLYGKMKRAITSFFIFFSDTIDEVIKQADKYTQVISRKELIRLTEETIEIHKKSQEEFLEEYLPLTSQAELDLYGEIEREFNKFMEDLLAFKENLNRLDKKEKVDEFAAKHFKIAVEQMNKVLTFTHGYLARILTDRVDQIYTSLYEILLRLRNNLNEIYEDRDEKISDLLDELYDMNKESLTLNRAYKRNSLATAEVGKRIEIIRNKIENYEGLAVTARVEEELQYWHKKVKELEEVRSIIHTIKKQQCELVQQQKMYNILSCTELAGSKHQCWLNMSENFAKRTTYLQENLEEISKCMVTIFCCRGNDHILCMDQIGQYFVDEFDHQVYIKNHFLDLYHVDCNGDFINVQVEPYYFDHLGRYILNQDKEKLYRCASCTSLYQLTQDGLLSKFTKDCGHSEMDNKNCRRSIKDLTDVEILPMTEPVDIKDSLPPDVVKYLWESFGSILPDALWDVGITESKNPIHHLAHMLLLHKYYDNTQKDLDQKKEEALKYRAGIFKGRKDKLIEDTKAWKAKQVQRRKPEESDDTTNQMLFEKQRAYHHFVKSLNYYY